MATAISVFRNRVLVEVPGCPVPRVDMAVVDALRQFCKDTYAYTKDFEVEDIAYGTVDSTDNDSLTIDLSAYFSSLDPIAPLKLQVDGGDWDLRELTLVNDNSNLTQIELQGVKFFNFPSLTTIKIFPFTDQSVNFDVYLKLAVKPNRSVTSVDDDFYNKDDWFAAVCSYAAAILQKMPKRAWTNYEQAELNFDLYRGFMGAAKIDFALGGTAGSVPIQGGYF